jgi:hypothetical protein
MWLTGILADAVNVNPNANGLPGGGFLQRLLDWGGQIALFGSLGAMLAGAAVVGWSQHTGNYSGATKGRMLALGGAVGAAITGLAPSAVNLLFNASRG